MNIEQFRYNKGNLSYLLLWHDRDAMVIDGGAVSEILTFLAERGLNLKIVTNTHGHDDHTQGNRQLHQETGAEFISSSDLLDRGALSFGGRRISLIPTPGHTMDSLVFSYDNILITGDTLFNGTVGNCYTGEYEIYFQSLKLLAERPGDSIVYAGHDLVAYSTGVINKIDPGNSHIREYRERYDRENVFTTLSDELRVNPFIRFNDPGLDSFRETLKMPLDSEYKRWRAMMTAH